MEEFDSDIGTSIAKLKKDKRSDRSDRSDRPHKKQKRVNMNNFVKRVEDDIYNEVVSNNIINENIQLQRNLMPFEYDNPVKINKNLENVKIEKQVESILITHKIYIDLFVYMVLFYSLCNKNVIDFIYDNIIYKNISSVPYININLFIRALLFGFLIFFYQRFY
jgi:hypothetical protein